MNRAQAIAEWILFRQTQSTLDPCLHRTRRAIPWRWLLAALTAAAIIILCIGGQTHV